jgi:NO-binding membrane sensor protein with MHYT domain
MCDQTHNIVRLAVALLLSLLFAWIFAISGMLVFSDMHSSRYTENEGGPCGNLLTCFVSYSYAGLMMDGLNQFLPRLSFPVDATDVFGHDTTKIVWELLFFLVSTLIGSIITGIICDTFGELRAAQDDAAMYRSSTNFITGISFSRTGTTLHHPSQQSTNYIQYAWLLLYLRQVRVCCGVHQGTTTH